MFYCFNDEQRLALHLQNDFTKKKSPNNTEKLLQLYHYAEVNLLAQSWQRRTFPTEDSEGVRATVCENWMVAELLLFAKPGNGTIRMCKCHTHFFTS